MNPTLHQQLLSLANLQNSEREADLIRSLKEAAANGQYSLKVKKENLDLCKYVKLCYGLRYDYEGEDFVIYWDFLPAEPFEKV